MLKPAIAAAIVLVGIICYGLVQFHSSLWQPELIRSMIVSLGIWGPLVYMALLIISVVVSYLPGAPLAILAGTIWPPFWAAIYTLIGGFAGAAIAYSIGRLLGEASIQQLMGKKFEWTFATTEKNIGRFIFFSRLVPILPFDLLSYGAGISQISWPVYASATLCGMVPSTFLLAYGTTFHLSTLTHILHG